MPTIQNIKGFFAFAIQQNRVALISNLNTSGYATPLNISNQDLVDKLYDIYKAHGSSEIEKIVAGINITNTNQQDLRAIRETLTGESSANQKTFLETLQGLWAGTSSTTGDSTTTTKTPAISPIVAAVVLLAIGAVITAIIFKFGKN